MARHINPNGDCTKRDSTTKTIISTASEKRKAVRLYMSKPNRPSTFPGEMPDSPSLPPVRNCSLLASAATSCPTAIDSTSCGRPRNRAISTPEISPISEPANMPMASSASGSVTPRTQAMPAA